MASDGDSALENVLNLIQSSVQSGLAKGEKVAKGILGPAYEPVRGLAQLLTPDVPAIYEAGKEFVEKPSPAALTAVGMTAALESPMGKAGKAVDKTASSLDKSIKWFRGSNNPKELEGSFTKEKEGVLGGGGVYITPNKEYAERFAKEDIFGAPKEGGFVNELEVDFKNPLIVNITSDKPYPELELLKKLGYKEDKAADIVEKAMEEKGGLTNEVKNKVIKQGYDGIILRKDGEIQEALIYDTNNIKAIAGEVPLESAPTKAVSKTSKSIRDYPDTNLNQRLNFNKQIQFLEDHGYSLATDSKNKNFKYNIEDDRIIVYTPLGGTRVKDKYEQKTFKNPTLKQMRNWMGYKKGGSIVERNLYNYTAKAI